jgi:2-methylcitrate dehydratase PrpD
MTTASQILGKFAAELNYADIPAAVLERAKYCVIDAVGVATFGSQFPWSRMVADYARRYGSGGPCSLIGIPGTRVHAPYAALANGVFTHAFEQDSLRDPGAGAHPGATLLPPLLAVCEEAKIDGKTAMAAFVAGNEVMMRIALASHHSPEKVGFHAPGLTGCYGAAIAAGRALGLNAQQLAEALGIAGSLSSGLLAFSKSKHGGMIKRLHLGRASESGILAARLAQSGYEAPETVLEGKFGFLDAYCRGHDTDQNLLTADLGKTWETLRICIKRYACHVNAHTPVQGLRELMAEHGFKGTDIAGIAVDCAERLLSHHNIVEPGDIMQAQYSVPFCIALAMHRDPEDPKNFNASAIEDPVIRASCREVELRPQQGRTPRSVRLNVKLKDGREFTRDCDKFKGMPADPLTREDLRRKFMLLTADMGAKAAPLFERLEKIETQASFSLA